MSKRAGVFLFLLLAALFLLVNRGAYQGYFQDDEIDNLSWAPRLPAVDYLKAALSPRFQENNFRPVGHFYFYAAGRAFHLEFPGYVAAIQLLHLFNVWLIWLLARRLGAKPFAAAAACVFFAFHMALFDAIWKPMYVFDVLCAAFCLLSLLAYAHGRWVWSFVAFWLAYKSKELAVMLPLVLACYELWFGQRRWVRLAPFFLVSLSFGLQGMLSHANRNNDYTFRFTPVALAATSAFYASRVFLVPWLGFALPVAAVVWRSRRTWLGLAMMAAFCFPLLFLPGRLFSAYCYLPFTGLALAFAGVADAVPPAAVAAFLLLFAPIEYREWRTERRATLAADGEVRQWVGGAARLASAAPRIDAALCAGLPPSFHHWGAVGALRYLIRPNLEVRFLDDAGGQKPRAGERVAVLTWDPGERQVHSAIHTPGMGDLSYLRIDSPASLWQLGEGWYGLEGDYRWIAPAASARLDRPEGARRFELRLNVGQDMLRQAGPPTVRISLNGQNLEPRSFRKSGWQEAQWDLPAARPGPVQVTFQVTPGFQAPGDSRKLGIAVGAFGFR
ncbi:MAG: hypothetical protein ABSF25_17310 [Bryobacteraceae bacterium]